MRRAVLAVLVSIALLSPVSAQTMCEGADVSAAPDDALAGFDPEAVYRQLGASDAWVARANWLAVTGTAPESRQECFAKCTEDYGDTLALCVTVNDVLRPGEHSWVTMARDNCFTAAREAHMKCLTPAQIMSCAP